MSFPSLLGLADASEPQVRPVMLVICVEQVTRGMGNGVVQGVYIYSRM